MELRLVADTNIFLECLRLEDLPWGELNHDPIVILLAKPVLGEIDRHKTATGRTRSRALAIYKRVRAMLQAHQRETVIHDSSPQVILRLLEATAPDPRRAELLDYGRTDDLLVGIVSALQDDDPGHRTELFTDDTGPASTADDMDLPFRMPSDNWRRPIPEGTESKRIRELEKDLQTYRAQEPDFKITAPGHDSADPLRVIRRVAARLTGDEIDEIIQSLIVKHPVEAVTRFPPPTVERLNTGDIVQTKYMSPAEDDVLRYREVEYPAWVKRCREVLTTLHEGRCEFEPPLVLRWLVNNKGTRPASRVRIAFTAKGRVRLRRIDEGDVEASKDKPRSNIVKRLPIPPVRPPLRKEVKCMPVSGAKTAPPDMTSGIASDSFARTNPGAVFGQLIPVESNLGAMVRHAGLAPFQRSTALMVHASSITSHASTASLSNMGAAAIERLISAEVVPVAPSIDLLRLTARSEAREPEVFYWDWPVDQDVTSGALTCDLWRHQTKGETFEFEVVFEDGAESDYALKGAVECVIHAENLTRPVRATVGVSRLIEHFNIRSIADILVAGCG